jgi:hypothetical protein
MAYRTIACSSWHEFKTRLMQDVYDGRKFQRGSFLFRGQRSAKWQLRSSFDRLFGGLFGAERANKSKKLMELFWKETEGLVLDEMIRKTESTGLALAQHNGLPTRLLDWTESPYVAAFFAFGEVASGTHPVDPDPEVAVWCLNAGSKIWSDVSGVSILDLTSTGNERLRNQLGKFTLNNTPHDSIEEYVEHCPDDDAEPLRKFTLPIAETFSAIADLEIMGINYTRMFPGIEGAARSAIIRLSLGD